MVQFLNFKVAQCCNDQINNEQDATHDHPVVDHTIVSQVKIRILETTAIAQRDHEPQEEVQDVHEVDSVGGELAFLLLLEVEEAEDM